MADDLEAFLRQAAQRRAGRKKPTPVARQQPTNPPSEREQPARPALRDEAEVDEVIEIVDAQVMPESKSRLESHVDTSKFDRRAEHLGEEVGMADEQLEARLHRKFDHRLGALDDGPGMPTVQATREVGPNRVREIRSLLADPQSLRNAIILSEILTPPHHRW